MPRNLVSPAMGSYHLQGMSNETGLPVDEHILINELGNIDSLANLGTEDSHIYLCPSWGHIGPRTPLLRVGPQVMRRYELLFMDDGTWALIKFENTPPSVQPGPAQVVAGGTWTKL